MSFTDSADSTDSNIDAYLLSKKPIDPVGQTLAPPEGKNGTQPSGADFDKILSSMPKMPSPPKLRDVPSAPQQNYHSPYQDFSGPAMFLAALGSLMTRHPMKVAMDSFSAMVHANVSGQKEVMDNARENWKAAMDVAAKQNEVEIERYKLVMEKYKEDANAAAAHMMAMASGFNDPMMAAMVRTGDMANVWNYIQDREKRGQQLAEFNLKTREQDEKERHDQAMEKSLGHSPQSVALQAFLDQHPDATPEQMQAFIQSGRAGRSAISMYMTRYLQEHPDATADDVKRAAQLYTTQTTAQNRFLSGPQGNTIRSLNVVVSHLQTMQELTDALGNGNVVAFNRVAQRFAEETGQSAPTNFDTAKQIVGAEIIKALGVAGAGTQTERQEAADAFNRARSPEQIAGAINVAKRLLVGQLSGLRRQFTASTGLDTDQFDEMLEPETRDYLRIDVGSGQTEVRSAPARPASGSVMTPGAAGVPPPDQRVKGKIYPTPKGDLRWNGTSWDQP